MGLYKIYWSPDESTNDWCSGIRSFKLDARITGLSPEVLVFDPYKRLEEVGSQVDDINIVLAKPMSSPCSRSDETFGMIKAELLDKMKEDVLIVNTSRGIS